MKVKIIILFVIGSVVITINSITEQQPFHHSEFGKSFSRLSFGVGSAYAYPPAVGILSNSKNCMGCHSNNGPWKEDDQLIIDILDMDTKKSLKQSDGSFTFSGER